MAMAVPVAGARLGLCSCQADDQHYRVNLAWGQGGAERCDVLALVGEHEYSTSRWLVAQSRRNPSCSVSCS